VRVRIPIPQQNKAPAHRCAIHCHHVAAIKLPQFLLLLLLLLCHCYLFLRCCCWPSG
jgi:hypothetical protein